MSMDTIMEDSDYSVSNTDAIVCGASDISGWTESLISDPNIPNSSSSSEDEYQPQQLRSAVAAGGSDNDDLMFTVPSEESSGSTNNNKQIEQKIRIFNVGSGMRSHECSICGLGFPTDQALGGHVRRHRTIVTSKDEYISTGDSRNDLMIVVPSGESSRSTNNKQQFEQNVGTIFNVDSSLSSSGILELGIHNASSDPLETEMGKYNENNHPSELSPTNPIDPSTDVSRTLVIVPSVNAEALAMVPLNQKSKRSKLSQSRIRRSFSVAEVEALVEAVEHLGTGRWRDVKMRAFDDADHRTCVDLKDKWKTLVHTARIALQRRRGEPVPQELLDRVLAAHAYWSQQQGKHHAEPLKIPDAKAQKVGA